MSSRSRAQRARRVEKRCELRRSKVNSRQPGLADCRGRFSATGRSPVMAERETTGAGTRGWQGFRRPRPRSRLCPVNYRAGGRRRGRYGQWLSDCRVEDSDGAAVGVESEVDSVRNREGVKNVAEGEAVEGGAAQGAEHVAVDL